MDERTLSVPSKTQQAATSSSRVSLVTGHGNGSSHGETSSQSDSPRRTGGGDNQNGNPTQTTPPAGAVAAPTHIATSSSSDMLILPQAIPAALLDDAAGGGVPSPATPTPTAAEAAVTAAGDNAQGKVPLTKPRTLHRNSSSANARPLPPPSPFTAAGAATFTQRPSMERTISRPGGSVLSNPAPFRRSVLKISVANALLNASVDSHRDYGDHDDNDDAPRASGGDKDGDVEAVGKKSKMKRGNDNTGTKKPAARRRSLADAALQYNATNSTSSANTGEKNSDGSVFRFGYGLRGERLPLHTSIFIYVQRKWILNPKSQWRQFWNVAILVSLIYYLIETPLRLGFLMDNCNNCATTIVHLLLDIFFMFDCFFLQIRTSFFIDDLNQTLLELNSRRIFWNYFTGYFTFDALTSIPVHHVLVRYYDVTTNPDVSAVVQVCYLLRMAKVLRYTELLAYYNSVSFRAGTLSADLLNIFKFVFGFFIIAHLSACMWMFIALQERIDFDVPLHASTWDVRTWPGNLGYTHINFTSIQENLIASHPSEGVYSSVMLDATTSAVKSAVVAPLSNDLGYLMALYWAVSTMTTVGYGDVIPRNDSEIAYCCLVIFIGAVTFGYIISNVSSIIQVEDDTDTKIRDKITSINAYMAYRKLPPDLQKKIRNHYEYTWKRKTVYDERAILQALPTYLRTRVALFLNQDLIRNVAFLRDLGSDCLALLVTELRPFRVSAGYWIFKQGSLGREMYFVSEGMVEVLGKKNKQLAILAKGSYLGEMSILASRPIKRSASVRALAATDLFALTKDSFEEVLKIYPELREEVQTHAEARLAEAMAGNVERDFNSAPAAIIAANQPAVEAAATNAANPAGSKEGTPGDHKRGLSRANTGAAAGGASALVVPFGSPNLQGVRFGPGGTPLIGPRPMASGGESPLFSHSRANSFLPTTGAANNRSLSAALLSRQMTAANVLSVPGAAASMPASSRNSVAGAPPGSSLGFNPYLSLPSSQTEDNEVDIRRTVLQGKQQLELIMHPELAEEITLETAEQQALLEEELAAERDFLAQNNHFTRKTVSVSDFAMNPYLPFNQGLIPPMSTTNAQALANSLASHFMQQQDHAGAAAAPASTAGSQHAQHPSHGSASSTSSFVPSHHHHGYHYSIGSGDGTSFGFGSSALTNHHNSHNNPLRMSAQFSLEGQSQLTALHQGIAQVIQRSVQQHTDATAASAPAAHHPLPSTSSAAAPTDSLAAHHAHLHQLVAGVLTEEEQAQLK